MLELLFSSSSRVKLLTFFISNPKQRYYLREVASLTKLPVQAVQRELARLETLGLLDKARDGNRLYFKVNEKFFLLPDLKNIILKTSGLGTFLRGSFQDAPKIRTAFIYGSYAKNQEITASDIDLFVIGDISGKELQNLVKKAEEITKREINFVLYDANEVRKRYQNKEPFILRVLEAPKIFVHADEDVLREIIERKKNSTS